MKTKKQLQPSEPDPVEKVVDLKRVVIASVICIAITGMIIWSLAQAAQKITDSSEAVLGQQTQVPNNVRLPQKGDASYMLKQARKNFSEFSVDEYTATGSAARSVIDTLQDLQQSETGIEDYFCQIFCN